MERYTIYCTETQTRKALELGAPIEPTCYGDGFVKQVLLDNSDSPLGKSYYDVPTAEQMIGWLLDRMDDINIIKDGSGLWLFIFYPKNTQIHQLKSGFSSRKEATLAAIDAALDYLSKNKK